MTDAAVELFTVTGIRQWLLRANHAEEAVPSTLRWLLMGLKDVDLADFLDEACGGNTSTIIWPYRRIVVAEVLRRLRHRRARR